MLSERHSMSLLSDFGRSEDGIIEIVYSVIASWAAVIMVSAVPLVGSLASGAFIELGKMLK
jgi:Flp pilus assembly pilin Flp